MAPLDTAFVNPSLCLVDPFGDRVGPSPESFDRLGLYLRAVREHRGWSLVQLATATRIRKTYLYALEHGDMSALPSRPFALGYVRAYAKALGLDGELAVVRFKQEFPEQFEPLRAPAGVRHQLETRRPRLMIAVGVVVAAVLSWNLVQRIMAPSEPQGAPPPPSLARLADIPPPPSTNGAFVLAAPTAPPVESTTPAPYITPGLEQVIAPMTAAAQAEVQGPDELNSGARFEARGAVYGAPANVSSIIIQARKPGLLVIRHSDKQVFFARQMRTGDAMRAPLGRGLNIDVVDGSAFYAYANEALVGPLTSTVTAVDHFAAPPPPPPAAVAPPAVVSAPVTPVKAAH